MPDALAKILPSVPALIQVVIVLCVVQGTAIASLGKGLAKLRLALLVITIALQLAAAALMLARSAAC